MSFASHLYSIFLSFYCIAAVPALAGFKIHYTPPTDPTAHTPRVYLALSQTQSEPASQIGNWFDLPHLYAIDDHDRDGKVEIDLQQDGYPVPLAKLAVGEYNIQAAVRLQNDWSVPGSGIGDLLSKPSKWKSGENPLRLDADRRVKGETFRQTGPVRDAYFHSKSLSQFHERPFNMRYSVILPDNWDPAKTYPVVVYIFGFGGKHSYDWHVRNELGEGMRDVITLVPDANCYWGHSVFVDSPVNGPWGKALTEELLPYIDKTYGGMGPAHRYVTGVSSGGWSSLWLQLTYPESFAGCWSYAPDPLDFSEFLQVDLHTAKSLYKNKQGDPTPMSLPMGPKGAITFEQFGHYERILGAGGQLKSFSATFSPRLPNGSPQLWYDQITGKIDHHVIKHWQPYAMVNVLKHQWQTQRQNLEGKIHLSVHQTDFFFLDQSVEAFQQLCKLIDCDAEFRILPGIGHHMPPGASDTMFDTIKADKLRATKVLH